MQIDKIYLDMDGVIVDFAGYTINVLGVKDADSGGSAKEMWAAIEKVPNFFDKLSMLPDAQELLDYVLSLGIPTEILTAIPSKRNDLKTAADDKKSWAAREIGPEMIVNTGPYSRDKKNWAKPNYVLIDDRKSNIKEWIAAGGIGILHKSAADTIEQLKAIQAKVP